MITLANVKHERLNVVYVGRAFGEFEGSVLGNPFKVGRDGTLEVVLEKYRRWLWAEYQKRDAVYAELWRLFDLAAAGDLKLGCWCDSIDQCHTGVIAKCLEWMKSQERPADPATDASAKQLVQISDYHRKSFKLQDPDTFANYQAKSGNVILCRLLATWGEQNGLPTHGLLESMSHGTSFPARLDRVSLIAD